MKFTDGYWQVRPGMHPLYAVEVDDVRADEAAGTLTKPAWCAITGLGFGAQLILIGSSPLGLIHLIFTIASLVYLADVRPALREVTSYRR